MAVNGGHAGTKKGPNWGHRAEWHVSTTSAEISTEIFVVPILCLASSRARPNAIGCRLAKSALASVAFCARLWQQSGPKGGQERDLVDVSDIFYFFFGSGAGKREEASEEAAGGGF